MRNVMFNDIIKKKKKITQTEKTQEKINKIWNLEKYNKEKDKKNV